MKLLDIIKKIKIDLTKCSIEQSSGFELDHNFEITPKDFLKYSKQDFNSGLERGNINALSNAKRAIDCQIDKIFHSLGLDPNAFSEVVLDFISKSKHSPQNKDLPTRLKFIQALNFAPAEIISTTRSFRHKLEHFYERPNYRQVSEAIDLAELFIIATDSRLKNTWDFSITDETLRKKSDGYVWDSISVDFKDEKKTFIVTGYIGKIKREYLEFGNNDIEFYFLIKLATSFNYKEDTEESLIELLKYINHPLPSEHIKVV